MFSSVDAFLIIFCAFEKSADVFVTAFNAISNLLIEAAYSAEALTCPAAPTAAVTPRPMAAPPAAPLRPAF